MTTMIRPHRTLWLPLVGLLAVAIAAGGCRSESYKAVRVQHDQNIRATREWWHTYNARSEGNLEALSVYADEYRESRREELAVTKDLIHESRQRREDKWHREADARRAWWRKQIKGDPDNIEPSLSKIAY